MPWFRVDDNLAFHPKTIAAGNAAMGLWVRAGSWSAHQLTDGEVPAEIWRSIGRIRDVERLVSAGLWVPIPGSDSYQFHQWTERQPTRDDVQKRRAANAERIRKWREEQSL